MTKAYQDMYPVVASQELDGGMVATLTVATETDTRKKYPRVYFDYVAESTAPVDLLVNRWTITHQAYKPVVKALLEKAGATVHSIRWSQYAGCTCPCSPGWIVNMANAPAWGHDYWLTIKAS